MQRHTLAEFVDFGNLMRFLRFPRVEQALYMDDQKGVSGIVQGIGTFVSRLHALEFVVTLNARALGLLTDLFQELSREPRTGKLNQSQCDRLKEAMEGVFHVFTAEANTKYVFSVTATRIDPAKLLTGPHSLLPSDVVDELPIVVRKDLVEAARCIAFEIPTAAVFMVNRATEGVLLAYYLGIVKRSRLAENKRLWGNMVTALQNRSRNRPPKAILDALTHIRRTYRNPTAHPNQLYDMADAQGILELCLEAIRMIVQDSRWKSTR